MNGAQPQSVLDELDELSARARAELEQIEAAIADLNAARQRINSFLRFAAPPPPKPPKPRRVRTDESGERLVGAGLKRVARAILDMDTTEPFTTRTVHEHAGFEWGLGITQMAFRTLRDRQIIGKHGRERTAIVYVVMDIEALRELANVTAER